MQFPNDADGQVLMRMVEHGFDLSKRVAIDFNIDFDHWLLSDDEMNLIRSHYPNAQVVNPDDEDLESGETIGYVRFQIYDLVSHDLVIKIQSDATNLTKNIGGICESWGVLQE